MKPWSKCKWGFGIGRSVPLFMGRRIYWVSVPLLLLETYNRGVTVTLGAGRFLLTMELYVNPSPFPC